MAGVVALLLVLVGQLAYSVSQESLSWDEGDHIYAGYMSWKHDFGLNPEHPPLVKAVATIPLLSMKLTEPPLHDRYFKTEAYLNGRDLIFDNNFYQIIFRARLMASIFAVLLGLIVFLSGARDVWVGRSFYRSDPRGVRTKPTGAWRNGHNRHGDRMLPYRNHLRLLQVCEGAVDVACGCTGNCSRFGGRY